MLLCCCLQFTITESRTAENCIQHHWAASWQWPALRSAWRVHWLAKWLNTANGVTIWLSGKFTGKTSIRRETSRGIVALRQFVLCAGYATVVFAVIIDMNCVHLSVWLPDALLICQNFNSCEQTEGLFSIMVVETDLWTDCHCQPLYRIHLAKF